MARVVGVSRLCRMPKYRNCCILVIYQICRHVPSVGDDDSGTGGNLHALIRPRRASSACSTSWETAPAQKKSQRSWVSSCQRTRSARRFFCNAQASAPPPCYRALAFRSCRTSPLFNMRRVVWSPRSSSRTANQRSPLRTTSRSSTPPPPGCDSSLVKAGHSALPLAVGVSPLNALRPDHTPLRCRPSSEAINHYC